MTALVSISFLDDLDVASTVPILTLPSLQKSQLSKIFFSGLFVATDCEINFEKSFNLGSLKLKLIFWANNSSPKLYLLIQLSLLNIGVVTPVTIFFGASVCASINPTTSLSSRGFVGKVPVVKLSVVVSLIPAYELLDKSTIAVEAIFT